MSEAEEIYIERNHAILVVNQMISSSDIDPENAVLDDTDLKELEDFLKSEDGLEHFSLPAFFGRIFFQDIRMKTQWAGVSKLSLIDRKLLIFTALGYEPNLVIESLGLSNSGFYWSRLTQLKNEYKALCQVNFDDELTLEIERQLKDLFNSFLDLSDQLETEQAKTKNRFQLKHIAVASFVILILAYIFAWNLLIPPSGEEIFDDRIDLVIQGVNSYSDSVLWLPDVLYELEISEYTEALGIMD